MSKNIVKKRECVYVAFSFYYFFYFVLNKWLKKEKIKKHLINQMFKLHMVKSYQFFHTYLLKIQNHIFIMF